jgi:hypothetical protein
MSAESISPENGPVLEQESRFGTIPWKAHKLFLVPKSLIFQRIAEYLPDFHPETQL